MCRLKTFCFRFSLRSGAIAAAVHTALGLVSMFGYGAGLLLWAYYYGTPSARHQRQHKHDVDREILILNVVGIVFLFVTLIKLIVLIIFCVGIHTNRSRLVLTWLLWTGLENILLPILIIVGAILTEDYWILLGLLYVICMIYLYIATCSYYQDLVEGLLRPSPL